MKTNRVKSQKYKLFKYHLLKLQVYSSQPFYIITNFSNSILEQIETYFKQVLKIIFEYHVSQFNILFVGFPTIFKIRQMKLIYFTNHNFISNKSWVRGFFRNRFSILTYLKLIQSQSVSKSFELLLTVKTKPHLVVVFNQKIEASTINEFYKAGIPILSFNWNSFYTYKTIGNFNFIEKNIKFTFFFLLYSLLKKTPLRKRKKVKIDSWKFF